MIGSTSLAVPLPRLLLAERSVAHVVAVGDAGEIRWPRFIADVSKLAGALPAGGRVLVLSEDAYATAVGVCAAVRAGCPVMLPPSMAPVTLTALAGAADIVLAHAVPVITDRLVLDPLAPPVAVDLPPAALGADVQVSLCSSGSTGLPVSHSRPLACLAAEVATLEACFAPPHRTVLATVPPYHIYGLLFRVLWPLAAGRPFARERLLYPEELLAAADGSAPLLVASPAFLTRAASVLDLAALAPRLSGAFSSGGPLPPAVAAAYNAAGAAPLTEVYGSTETGGLAFRRVADAAAPEPWTPLPGVRLTAGPDGWSVASPHVAAGTAPLSDRLEPLDGRFRLLGRADRIVKVEETRVDLDGVETRLRRHDAVAGAAVLPLETSRGRTVLAAVVVPSDDGWDRLAASGKQAVAAELRQWLRGALEPVVVPRRWRFVRALPETPQGKTPLSALRALFEPGQDRVQEPALLAQVVREGRVNLRLLPSPDLVFFQGHFDGVPILPGVAQLHWAIETGRRAFGIAGRFQRLEAVKFFRTIRPAQELVLDLVHSGAAKLAFTLSSTEGQHSSGRIIFSEAS